MYLHNKLLVVGNCQNHIPRPANCSLYHLHKMSADIENMNLPVHMFQHTDQVYYNNLHLDLRLALDNIVHLLDDIDKHNHYYKTYHLHKKDVVLNNSYKRTNYYFAKAVISNYACDLVPEGKKVVEYNGLPFFCVTFFLAEISLTL